MLYTLQYHTKLYCALLFLTILYNTTLFYALQIDLPWRHRGRVSSCTALCYTIQCFMLYNTTLYYTVLYYSWLTFHEGTETGWAPDSLLYCTVLYHTILCPLQWFCCPSSLYKALLHYSILCYTILQKRPGLQSNEERRFGSQVVTLKRNVHSPAHDAS